MGIFLERQPASPGRARNQRPESLRFSPCPLGLNVQGPSAETEFKAVSAGSAAEALAGGTQDKVDAAIAKGGPQGTKGGGTWLQREVQQGIDAVGKHANRMEKLNALKGAKGRDQMRQEVNAGAWGDRLPRNY